MSTESAAILFHAFQLPQQQLPEQCGSVGSGPQAPIPQGPPEGTEQPFVWAQQKQQVTPPESSLTLSLPTRTHQPTHRHQSPWNGAQWLCLCPGNAPRALLDSDSECKEELLKDYICKITFQQQVQDWKTSLLLGDSGIEVCVPPP